MLELAFRPQPFNGTAKSGACHCDVCKHSEVESVDDEFDDDEIDPPCPVCGHDPLGEIGSVAGLRDIVVDPPAESGVWGTLSTTKNKTTTTNRCKTEHQCPVLKGLRDVTQINGVPFEYIGGFDSVKGILWAKTKSRWIVNEYARRPQKPSVGKNQKVREIHILPRTGDGLANFLANMKAVGLDVEALLTMGSVNCRCIAGTDRLSDHSNGDAYDFGGLRLVGGREILVANATCDPADRKILHRANACLRLSFARTLDYHHINPYPYKCGPKTPKWHWNHIHCDTNQGKPLHWYRGNNVGWRYVRESLGLPVTGGKDQALKDALKAFAGNDVFDTDRKTALGLSKLYMREAART